MGYNHGTLNNRWYPTPTLYITLYLIRNSNCSYTFDSGGVAMLPATICDNAIPLKAKPQQTTCYITKAGKPQTNSFDSLLTHRIGADSKLRKEERVATGE
jgi:hypothetical protein